MRTTLTLTLAAVLGITAPARADVIYNNNPGTDAGFVVIGPGNTYGYEYQLRNQLAVPQVLNFFAINYNAVAATTGSASVFLATGTPGHVIETFAAPLDPLQFGGVFRPTFTPTLAPGEAFWVGITGGTSTVPVDVFLSGSNGPKATGNVYQEDRPGSGFFLATTSGTLAGVFAMGVSVPEPGPLALGAVGVVGMTAARIKMMRRKRA